MSKQNTTRNKEIFERYQKGENMPELAKIYNITKQRVHQIVKNGEKKNLKES